MSDQGVRIPNVHLCLQKIRELVDAVPRSQGDGVDWNDLATRRENAEMALTHLHSIFGSQPGDQEIKVGCRDQRMSLP